MISKDELLSLEPAPKARKKPAAKSAGKEGNGPKKSAKKPAPKRGCLSRIFRFFLWLFLLGVLAAAGGTVADVREDALLGTTVVIQHKDGYRTTYASLEPELAVKFGETVTSGQLIGAVGVSAGIEAAAGPHLHFSVSKDGIAVDPAEFLEQ